MKAIIEEFKTFINRGNVIDLAVGIIVGTAFGKVTSSLVSDVLMPPLGFIVGGINFTSLKLVIGNNSNDPVTINYGNFIQNTFDFLIIAIAVFILVKMVNRFEGNNVAKQEPSKQEQLLTEIRDLLKK